MPQLDSIDKVVHYFAAVTAEPFTWKRRTYPVPRLTVSTGIVRGYTCPPGCGGCCPRFSLDYLPTEPRPDLPVDIPAPTSRSVAFNGADVPLFTDAQDDHKDDRCRHLDRSTGRCGIHGRQPFSCDFELIRITVRDDATAHMTQRLFSRGWNMKRTDGGRGALCEMTPADPDTVADTKRRLARLDEWATHFGIRTRVPDIVAWIDTIADAPESHPDLVLPAGPRSTVTDTQANAHDDIVRVDVADLRHFPGNAKQHRHDVIAESLTANGQYKPLVVRFAPGDDERHNVVLAGNGTLATIRDDLKEQTARVQYLECDDATAKRINLVDNRSQELGGYDVDLLLAQLDDMPSFEGTGYDADAVAALLASADLARAAGAADAERQSLKDARPNPRRLPLDAIFTIHPRHVAAMIAADCGLQVGVQSDSPSLLNTRDRWEWKFRLAFVDNEWKSYDHEKHRAFVEAVKPKYATVRDVMTREQCAEAGIDYYPFEQIMEWADDLAQYAENVIIIPKVDVIADIPEQYVLGYSVPTSYGGTPLPASSFAGRRVHLLGGSWRNQLRYLAALGDDVVSLDFNHCNNISQWGQFVLPDGTTKMIRDLQGHDNPDPSNANTVALALSLGNIGRAIFELTQGKSGAQPADMKPGAPDPEPGDDPLSS